MASYEEAFDEDAVEHKITYLPASEFSARELQNLPLLLNGTARRKKTLDSLFPHLANQIYRCREYPHGVYINEFGEVCPNDPRSGLYQIAEGDVCDEEADEDEDEDDDRELVYEDDEEDEDDSETDSVLAYEDDESDAGGDSDWQQDAYDEEAEYATERQNSPRCRKRKRCTEAYLQELKNTVETQARAAELQQQSRREPLLVSKRLKEIERMTACWSALKRQKPQVLMNLDTALYATPPVCTFMFKKRNSAAKNTVFTEWRCETNQLVCLACDTLCPNMPELHTHVCNTHLA